jgi:CarD family transcriptional regulator
MMASAEVAAAAQEDGQQAAETGTSAAARLQGTKSTGKPSPGAGKGPARSVAADMPAPAVKVGAVYESAEGVDAETTEPPTIPEHEKPEHQKPEHLGPEHLGPENGGPENHRPENHGPENHGPEDHEAVVPEEAASGGPDDSAPGAPEDEATATPEDPAVADASANDESDVTADVADRPMRVPPQHSGMRPGQHGGPAQIPRMPAKAEIFVEGDHVVYPTHGVGKVERIATEEIAGHRLELIHITFEENRMTLRVPVSKARSAGLRKLATRKMFDDALAVLKGRARVKRTMWSRRAQEYEAKINSGDPLAIAEVVRDLHRNAGQPDQSFSERQIYEAAMDRLAAELAALDKTDKPTAVNKLTEFLKTV